MALVPYPSFVTKKPVDATRNRAGLPAVGRCRINPEIASDRYRDIVAKNVEQARVSVEVEDVEAQKKLKKQFMKQGVAMAKDYLTGTMILDVSVIDVEVVVHPEELISTDGCLAACLLDAGCQFIVTDGMDLEALDAAKIPRERLVAHFQYDKLKNESNNLATHMVEAFKSAAVLASAISVELSQTEDVNLDTVMSIVKMSAQINNMEIVVQIQPSSISEDALEKLAKQLSAQSPHGRLLLVDPTARQLGLSFAGCMRTDRDDGLYTTVVCARNGEALGLVYSSRESLIAALECGRGVYYSRSRQQLWRKGDTSGHYQTLHRLDIDCDGDALRFTVTQRGDDKAAFCHLNTLTCWGKPRGILHLQETLQGRFKDAPEGSYTKRLFDDPELLREKLVEEAQELSEAKEPNHVAEELADVLYFAMVRAVAAGVSFDDAMAELDRRSRKVTRRKGDSKTFRTATADQILGKKDDGGK